MLGGTLTVIIIVVGNGIGDPISNPGKNHSYFITLRPLGKKAMNVV